MVEILQPERLVESEVVRMELLKQSKYMNDILNEMTLHIYSYKREDVWHNSPFVVANQPLSIAILGSYIYASPFLISRRVRLSGIGIDVSVGNEVNTSLRLGIYRDNNILPSKLVLDAGELNYPTGITTGIKSISIDKIISSGLYWIVILANQDFSIYATDSYISPMGGNTIVAQEGYYVQFQTYGALPNIFPSNPSTGNRLFLISLKWKNYSKAELKDY